MTPDDRTPRKRRRRRRRGGSAGPEGQPQGNGNGPSPGNEAAPSGQYGAGGGGRRRRRSRRGRGSGEGREGARPSQDTGTPPLPLDIAPGELVPAKGVLFIKQNGTGILVKPENNYYTMPGDPIVPRSLVEKLHLQAGLEISGSARRAGNNLEFIGLETIEGMTVEEYRDARRPFSELISKIGRAHV